MEKKLMDKIDKAWELVKEKEKKHNAEWKEFNAEWYTKEIKEMIYVIVDKKKDYYHIKFADGMELSLHKDEMRIYYGGYRTLMELDEIKPITLYDDDLIKRIAKHAKDIETAHNIMKELREHIQEVINNITQKYKEITEEQTRQIDNVFKMLDIQDDPIKHIKVTVEWV